MKKFKVLLVSCIAVSTMLTGSAFASPQEANSSAIVLESKSITIAESAPTVYEDTTRTISNDVRQEKSLGTVEGIDKETGEIIDQELYKKSLLNALNTDPEKFKYEIENIDSLVAQSAANSRPSTLNDSISPASLVLISQGWDTEPYITSSQPMVTYSTSWIVEDNYRSSTAVNVKYSKSMKTSTTIGFSGAAEIKSKLSFTASKTHEYTTAVEQGATVGAWTIWGKRPYIKWTKQDYKGVWYQVWHNGSEYITGTIDKTGTNNRLDIAATEYWDKVNTAKNPNASSPTPPTGQPK
ncbi:hypothetical protein [Brevibacillus reuszeri]|uniref:hypothetical protein n=1 Tax=Brevibacillus reuszeri TaxID=54915 RepID=UPI000CCC0F6A|nr:hypothetical protein [Brevibacillus reuszeri]